MIDTIIFDFGGVLLDLDFDRTFTQLEQVMGLPLPTDLDQDHDLIKHYLRYEQGLITDETLIWNIQRMATHAIEPRAIVTAWNAMLLGWNPARLDMLLALRKRYRVLLLSNTNHMHIQWVRRDLYRNHGIRDFEATYFDKVYYSFEIHCRKPDTAIYDYVSRDADLAKASTLFIDDNAANVDAGRAHGWQSVQHDPAQHDIIDVIEDYLEHIGSRSLI